MTQIPSRSFLQKIFDVRRERSPQLPLASSAPKPPRPTGNLYFALAVNVGQYGVGFFCDHKSREPRV
jgi:hypothetical protein